MGLGGGAEEKRVMDGERGIGEERRAVPAVVTADLSKGLLL